MPQLTLEQSLQLALQHHQAGRLPQAEQLYRQILAQNPRQPNALHLLGLIALQVNRHDLAIDLIRQSLAINSRNPQAYCHLGAALMAKNQLDPAITAFRQAIALQPAYPEALSNLATLLRIKGELDDAIIAFRQVTILDPNSAAAQSNLGTALAEKKLFDEAIIAFRRAIALQPNSAEIHNNLGLALRNKEQLHEAIIAIRQATELQPSDAEFHWNYALLLLLIGDLTRGWEEFEWRLALTTMGLNRGFTQKQWDGSPANGQTILLHGEGGFGDTIQFVRLVPQVHKSGAKLILECQPALAPLLACVPGVDRVIPRGEPLPPFDWQIPLQGLPRVLGITLDNIPGNTPYLKVPEERASRWAGRVSGDGRLKVGLVWAGSQADHLRSRSLEIFAPLGSVPNVRFFSLQVGPEAHQKPPEGLCLVDLSAELSDFADTAAVLEQLDLVISVDTSVAHLAGALNRPVWVLIPTQNDFRWLLNRIDSPWYPTMRLFRQPPGDDWTGVMNQVAEVLALWPAQSAIP